MSADNMTLRPHPESRAVTWAEHIQELPSDRHRKKFSVLAIVVSYNRKQLLLSCINALLGQSADCDILIVDNDSTDGTHALLVELSVLENPRVYYLRLRENLGGAGGFATGMWYAMRQGWEWMWLMDDDALPDSHALQSILDISPKPANV
ncbi:MAG TPA: glycosyltransferase, partial [Anaerolineales bacterium]|nr:glycosyltransferase [Anaerolineales bacterium]